MPSCQKRHKQNTYDNYIVNYLYNRLSKSFQLPLEFSIQKAQKKVKIIKVNTFKPFFRTYIKVLTQPFF